MLNFFLFYFAVYVCPHLCAASNVTSCDLDGNSTRTRLVSSTNKVSSAMLFQRHIHDSQELAQSGQCCPFGVASNCASDYCRNNCDQPTCRQPWCNPGYCYWPPPTPTPPTPPTPSPPTPPTPTPTVFSTPHDLYSNLAEYNLTTSVKSWAVNNYSLFASFPPLDETARNCVGQVHIYRMLFVAVLPESASVDMMRSAQNMLHYWKDIGLRTLNRDLLLNSMPDLNTPCTFVEALVFDQPVVQYSARYPDSHPRQYVAKYLVDEYGICMFNQPHVFGEYHHAVQERPEREQACNNMVATHGEIDFTWMTCTRCGARGVAILNHGWIPIAAQASAWRCFPPIDDHTCSGKQPDEGNWGAVKEPRMIMNHEWGHCLQFQHVSPNMLDWLGGNHGESMVWGLSFKLAEGGSGMQGNRAKRSWLRPSSIYTVTEQSLPGLSTNVVLRDSRNLTWWAGDPAAIVGIRVRLGNISDPSCSREQGYEELLISFRTSRRRYVGLQSGVMIEIREKCVGQHRYRFATPYCNTDEHHGWAPSSNPLRNIPAEGRVFLYPGMTYVHGNGTKRVGISVRHIPGWEFARGNNQHIFGSLEGPCAENQDRLSADQIASLPQGGCRAEVHVFSLDAARYPANGVYKTYEEVEAELEARNDTAFTLTRNGLAKCGYAPLPSSDESNFLNRSINQTFAYPAIREVQPVGAYATHAIAPTPLPTLTPTSLPTLLPTRAPTEPESSASSYVLLQEDKIGVPSSHFD